MRSRLRAVGNVRVEVWRRGRRLWSESGHNLVVDTGLDLIRDLLNRSLTGGDPALVGLTHFALGTDATAVDPADTALGAEVLRSAVARSITSDQALRVQLFVSSTEANGETIREAGLFNAAAAGVLFSRYVLETPVVKDNTIAVTFTWDLAFAAVS